MSRNFYEHTYVRKFSGRFKGTSEFDLKIGVSFVENGSLVSKMGERD